MSFSVARSAQMLGASHATLGRRTAVACGAAAACAASLLSSQLSSQASPRRLAPLGIRCRAYAVECDDGRSKRRPVGGTAGSCDSGIRFYAARSVKAAESASCFGIVERLHAFGVFDGIPGLQDGGSQCSKFCGQRLPSLVAQSFMELPSLRSRTGQDGAPLTEEEAVASAWADALTMGFGRCDGMAAAEQVPGACGALFCVVARSGVYVGSVGLGRAVIGTEEVGGNTVDCDEASSPHGASSELEVSRLGSLAQHLSSTSSLPTRFLGGSAEKLKEPLRISLPDVVRHAHSEGRRYVILGSPALWENGPRLPLQWAVEAYRKGHSPADELISRSPPGSDVVALVLVLPQGLGLGEEDGPLPPHEDLVWPPAAA